MDSRYQFWLDRIRELDEQTVKRTNGKQTYASYTKQYADEMWLTGTKSVLEGYADKVVKIKCDSSLAGTTTHNASMLGFQITYDLDECPINTSPFNVRIGNKEGKTLTSELEKEIREKFLTQFEDKQRQVLPMAF